MAQFAGHQLGFCGGGRGCSGRSATATGLSRGHSASIHDEKTAAAWPPVTGFRCGGLCAASHADLAPNRPQLTVRFGGETQKNQPRSVRIPFINGRPCGRMDHTPFGRRGINFGGSWRQRQSLVAVVLVSSLVFSRSSHIPRKIIAARSTFQGFGCLVSSERGQSFPSPQTPHVVDGAKGSYRQAVEPPGVRSNTSRKVLGRRTAPATSPCVKIERA